MGEMWINPARPNRLLNGKWLSDLHINAAQELLSRQFSLLGGFQSILEQYKQPIKNLSNAIQTLNVGKNHWTVLTTINDSDDNQSDTNECPHARYYDSQYSNLTYQTENIIAVRLSSVKLFSSIFKL